MAGQGAPDISKILAALAAQQQPQNGTPVSQQPTPQPLHGYPPVPIPQHTPQPPNSGYLPQPSNTGSVDLSSIRPVNSGSVSIADAIAKAKSIAADRGVQSFDPRSAPPRDDPRLSGRGYQQGRSRSRSPPRRDAYSSNPYRDERRDDSRRGAYRRSPSPDRNFRGSRDAPSRDGNRGSGGGGGDGESETIRVKSNLVGLIIGRNGENLRRVEGDSGARVQFIQAKDSQQTERQCTITGNLRAREQAKSAIFAIIEENGGQNVHQEKGAYTAGMPGRAKVNLPALREGEASSQIMVPDKTVGLIIGRGGETIKDLQERSGCHVNIVGENKSVNGLRPVNLIGSERATAHAKELILEIVESDSKAGQSTGQRDRGSNNYDSGMGNQGGQGSIDKTIYVPSEAVGMIIGKGGETIKDLQRTTGCKINVCQPQRPDIERQIDLSGTSSALADAERVIWEKVDTVKQRDAAAGRSHGGSGGRDQSSSGYDNYGQAQAPAYGQYTANGQQAQLSQQIPAFQMPTGQTAQADPNADPYAAWGGQANYLAYWMALQQQGQQGQQGGASGTQ